MIVDYNGVQIPGYNIVAPSFVASHKIDKNQTIKLSYSKRIERPDFRDINPFVNSSDPYNVTYGNPKLQPEVGNNFALGYNKSFDKGGSINISAFYLLNTSDIKPVTFSYASLSEADNIYTNVLVSTRKNVGSEIKAGLNISATIPISKGFDLCPNILIDNRRVMIKIPNIPNFAMGYEYRLNLNAAYQFKNDFVAEAFTNYNSPQLSIQGKNPSFFAYSFAIRKQFLKKKASFGFTTTVPFNEYINQATIINQPGYTQYSLRRVPYRSFGISLSYKFGKLDFKKNPSKDNTDNLQQPTDQ